MAKFIKVTLRQYDDPEEIDYHHAEEWPEIRAAYTDVLRTVKIIAEEEIETLPSHISLAPRQ